jgi:transaldolase/glucose-6-phosphate isomerase
MFRRRMKRLGWIQAPRASLAQWGALAAFADAARRDGLTRALVCGMGGSSLVAEVLARVGAGSWVGALDVLDSTDPAAVLAAERAAPRDRMLFLVVSKSGTTVETLAFCRYFAARARPEQFVAVTEPGTPLDTLARERRFRAVFPHPPDVGGRYGALTVVGMLPAALIGADGRVLLERALAVDVARAKAWGAALARAALAGRDKLVLRPPARVAAIAAWVEQLVAESSGKAGRGVIPVVDDPAAERRPDTQVVSEFSEDPLDHGAEFLKWEFATWELCKGLGVNAFDQPDVEAAKAFAREELVRRGSDLPGATLSLGDLARAARPGDYLAILAYLPPRPDVVATLRALRAAWAARLGVATTLGFGPRYLHSTGQLHKGGPNTGLFLVVTTDDSEDAEIPEMGITFGRLKRAQAMGDIRALLAKGRRVAHVHVSRPEDVVELAGPL